MSGLRIDGRGPDLRAAIGSALLLVAGCSAGRAEAAEHESTELAGKITLTGSSTVAPLCLEIAKRFEALHPRVRIDVQTGGSSRGIADARAGLADIGMASRALTAEEGLDLRAHPIARDGVALIVHARNAVRALDDGQVRAVYSGAATRWSAVGGADSPITVISKAEGRATLEVFLAYFGLDVGQLAPDVVIGDNQQAIKLVAGDPDAIAFVSIGTAEYDAQRGLPIRLLASGGIEATTANVLNGRYPIARPLLLVTSGDPGEPAASFIEYCRSSAVHDLVADLNFVALVPGR